MIDKPDLLTETLRAKLDEHSDLIVGKGESAQAWAELSWVEAYSLALDDESDDLSLARAIMTGWHLLTEDSDGEAVAILVRRDSELGPVFEGVERGPQITAAAHLLEKPSDQLAAISETIPPRLLCVPGLHLRALWYASEGGDQIVPLAVTRPPFEASAAISRVEFEALVHPMARNTIDLHRELAAKRD